MALATITTELNPAQQAVLDALAVPKADRPAFDPGLRRDLRDGLEAGLADCLPALDGLGIASQWVSKHWVSSILGCEARALAEDEARFEGWTVARARGTIAHRAIESAINVRGEPVPAVLVDHAISRLCEPDAGPSTGPSTGLGEWLARLPEPDRADLRGEAVEKVSAFLESWPPLSSRWRPRCESRVRAELCGDRIVLAGKVDLSLGAAEGTTAGKVLVDLKTGGFVPTHLDDLRFYALIESVKIGVPPRRLATHYLESGRLVVEDVTVALLEAALHRAVDAVHRWVELRVGDRGARTRAGPACRWCPLRSSCAEGLAHLREADDWSV